MKKNTASVVPHLKGGFFLNMESVFRTDQYTDPMHGDSFVDMNKVKGKCINLTVIRVGRNRIDKDRIIKILEKNKGIYRLRLGECFMIKDSEGNTLRIFNVLNHKNDRTFVFDRVPDTHIDSYLYRKMQKANKYILCLKNNPPPFSWWKKILNHLCIEV